MIKLTDSMKAWGTSGFEAAMKEEVQGLDNKLLPLQAGLSQSSHVSDSKVSVIILKAVETSDTLQVKTGIFYAGIIAGSCCADDPTPVSENTEYCELLFEIDKTTAGTIVELLESD